MKKFIKSTVVIASMTVAVGVIAADGTVTINGAITDTTCDISVNGGSKDATVVLPTVSVSSLAAAGDTAGSTPFNFKLTGCSGTSLSTAIARFENGAFVDTNTGRLKINSSVTDPATNVQVQLLNSELNPIVAGETAENSSQNDVPVSIASGSGTLNYYARYYATGQSTAGAVVSQVDYTIVYQ
ncbi:fimbrial protein [Pseudomonas chlororaphis]|uniref:fimbrial protein n=1 Tax=Pseudomonas chlororaphis TaxID=587753 RepID=UPI0023671B44|nr:fimbrial protein [Pseudomonas chlororaphis]WDH19989.1 fimbrial protein [Pseudomonas chlororaphis]